MLRRNTSGHRRAHCLQTGALFSTKQHHTLLRNWKTDRSDVQFHFKCTQCGKCCTGKGGRVRVNDHEMREIALLKRISLQDVQHKFMKHRDNQWWLRQTADDSQCIFLDGKKCSIYAARPTQCRTFPWWPQHMISDYDWHLAAKDCEGIRVPAPDTDDSDASDYSFRDISPHLIVHDIHRSGENFTHNELVEMLNDLQDVDEAFVEEYEKEFFDKYSRHIVYQDEKVTVMDTFLDGTAPSRSFFFNDRMHLTQSEVTLHNNITNNSDDATDAVMQFDRSTLTLDVHRGMCIPLLWLSRGQPLNMAVIGSGAASLPLFLLEHLTEIERLDAVEPNAKVNAIAREFFGLSDIEKADRRLSVFEQFGEEFLANVFREARYDCIMIDVEAGGSEDDGIQAPPLSMLSTDFLSKTKQTLTARGILIINVITTTDEALNHVKTCLGTVFSDGVIVMLPRNSIFCVFNDPDMGPVELNKQQLIEVLRQHPIQAHQARTPALLESSSSITVSSWGVGHNRITQEEIKGPLGIHFLWY